MKRNILYGILGVLAVYLVYNWGYKNGLASGVKAAKAV